MAIKSGSTVTLNYRVYIDSELIDQTSPSEPLTYTQGTGQVIPGLEKGVEGLDRGDKKELIIPPEEAYGQYSEEKILHIPKEDLPGDVEPEKGMQLQAMSQEGSLYVGVVTDVKSDHVDVDFNHPLAGKTLQLEVEVEDVSG